MLLVVSGVLNITDQVCSYTDSGVVQVNATGGSGLSYKYSVNNTYLYMLLCFLCIIYTAK